MCRESCFSQRTGPATHEPRAEALHAADMSRFAWWLISMALVLLLLSSNLASPQGQITTHLAPPTEVAQPTAGRGVLAAAEFDMIPIASPPPPPPAALAIALNSPPPPPGTPCPPGCEVRGVCNREYGRCECPPLMAGPACELSIAPSCSKMWGLELPIPPCQAFAEELTDYRDFPPTCECLAECQALNVRVVYVDNCVNASQTMLQKGSDNLWVNGKMNSKVPYPWRDIFGDGKWLRQAYKPGRRDIQLTDAQLSEKNLALAGRLHADGKKSLQERLCSGNGLFTQVMPWWHRGTLSVCHCIPGWYGKECEYGPGDGNSPVVKTYCV